MNPSCLSTIIRRYAAAAVLTGRLPCDLYGTPKQLEAFAEAFYATREFDRLLAECDELPSIMKALNVKRASASRFRREFGVTWPG
jgi:hypothetical protein